jgi:hypothetical protein
MDAIAEAYAGAVTRDHAQPEGNGDDDDGDNGDNGDDDTDVGVRVNRAATNITTTIDEMPRIRLVRTNDSPLNDYEEQLKILYGAFPTVFPLAQGCGFDAGPLSLPVRQFLLRHFSRRPARHQRLLMSLHDVKSRADAGRVMKAFVKTDSTPLRQWHEVTMAPNFPERLQNSRENPASVDAKALLKELTPVIMITGGRIPFSPLERGTRASVELWSMIRMMGFPNEYWTVGLDETRSAIVARHACFKQSGVIGDIASAESRSAADFWHNMGGDANGNYDFNLVHHANNLPQNLPDLD